MSSFFYIISLINDFYWDNIAWILIAIIGIYLTIVSRGLQFRALINCKKNLKKIFTESKSNKNKGVHPFKLYFASVGGMVGIGNIVGISSAVMIGGPGAIFWILIASISGMLLKYSEVYLGIKYRYEKGDGSYIGGPLAYLQAAFKSKIFAYIAAFLICLYGVEVYSFVVIIDSVESSFGFNRTLLVITLLLVVIYSAVGGIKRLANICSSLMPIFMITYVIIAIYIIIDNGSNLALFFRQIIDGAFNKTGAIGGFAGSSIILTTRVAMARTVYSGDIGIGYDSIVQSQTKINNPKQQASLAIYGLAMDTLFCIITSTMVGVTGAWYKLSHMETSEIVPTIFAGYIPYSNIFVTILFFIAGFTTVIAYTTVGAKCAEFISAKYGRFIYIAFSIILFAISSRYSQDKLMMIMEFLSGALILINIIGILKLRKKIDLS